MMKRQIIIVASGIALLAVSYFTMIFLKSLKEEPEKKAPEEVKRYVMTRPVVYEEVPTEILAHGRVRTAEHLDMVAQVGGRMFRGNIDLKEGQRFKKGSLLYKIDDTEAKLSLQAQKSNFLRDLAAILPDLKMDYPDNFNAWEKYFESISIEKKLPELPGFKSSKEKTFLATKNIFSSYYTIKSAEANLLKYYYYAPFDGSIFQVNVRSGSHVSPGTNIGRIIQSGNVEVKVDVDVKDIEWITIGAPAHLSAEGGITQWSGKITRIGDYVNPNTQSIDVFIGIHEKSKPIYDGQYLQAVIPGKSVKDAMLIPREAIFNGNEVFVLQDSLLKVHEINIHKINPETVVFEGLTEGADIVVEPLINAHNNMKAYKLESQEEEINIEEKKASAKLVNN